MLAIKEFGKFTSWILLLFNFMLPVSLLFETFEGLTSDTLRSCEVQYFTSWALISLKNVLQDGIMDMLGILTSSKDIILNIVNSPMSPDGSYVPMQLTIMSRRYMLAPLWPEFGILLVLLTTHLKPTLYSPFFL